MQDKLLHKNQSGLEIEYKYDYGHKSRVWSVVLENLSDNPSFRVSGKQLKDRICRKITKNNPHFAVYVVVLEQYDKALIFILSTNPIRESTMSKLFEDFKCLVKLRSEKVRSFETMYEIAHNNNYKFNFYGNKKVEGVKFCERVIEQHIK